MNRERVIEGIWERDSTVWTGGDEAQWLGWLDEPLHVEEQLGEIRRYAESLHDAVDAVVLMGMGGSSLAPEVLRRTFGVDWFHVLDTTHPKAIRALEEQLDLSRTLFVSRVDTETDKRLEAIGTEEALALRGKLAIANAKLAYEHYQEAFSGSRWAALDAKGALSQRCLWASTSTKNPAYRDVMYVEELIGPHTVNTMPEETIRDFQDHGEVRGDTVLEGVDEAHELLDKLAAVGIDYDDVVETLEREGVQKFSDSFTELLDGVMAKRGALVAS